MSRFSTKTSLALFLVMVANGWGQNSKSSAPLFYDVAQETKLTGTVANVLGRPTPGMFPGSHLTLATPSGSFDISLGLFALVGEGSLAVSAGQQVEITGIPKTFHSKPLFLARLVRVGSNLYAVRTPHGLPVPPKSHLRANQDAENGDAR